MPLLRPSFGATVVIDENTPESSLQILPIHLPEVAGKYEYMVVTHFSHINESKGHFQAEIRVNIDTETDFDSWRLILAEYLQIDFTSVKRKKNGDVSYEYTEEFQCQHGTA